MLPILLALAGAATNIVSKTQQDALDRARAAREAQLFRQQEASKILGARSQAGGVDTQSSDLARDQTAFDAQQFANRRDTSGDWTPFVKSLGALAQGVAADVSNSSGSQPAQHSAASTGLSAGPDVNAMQPIDPDEAQKVLMRLSGRSGGYYV